MTTYAAWLDCPRDCDGQTEVVYRVEGGRPRGWLDPGEAATPVLERAGERSGHDCRLSDGELWRMIENHLGELLDRATRRTG